MSRDARKTRLGHLGELLTAKALVEYRCVMRFFSSKSQKHHGTQKHLQLDLKTSPRPQKTPEQKVGGVLGLVSDLKNLKLVSKSPKPFIELPVSSQALCVACVSLAWCLCVAFVLLVWCLFGACSLRVHCLFVEAHAMTTGGVEPVIKGVEVSPNSR